MRNIFISNILISLFLFTHWALNQLLHLNNASVSLATMRREICCTCGLHRFLWMVCVVLNLLLLHHVELFLIFNDAHFVYLVLVHVSLHCSTVTDSSGPCVSAHTSWSLLVILLILMIVNDLIRVISVSTWRLEYLW